MKYEKLENSLFEDTNGEGNEMFSGMKTGLIGIRRKFTGYTIFRKDHHGWTCNASIILILQLLWLLEITISIKISQKKETYKIEVNLRIIEKSWKIIE